MAIIARISDSDIDRKRSSSPPTRSSLFTLKRRTNGPSRCLKSAQAARIVAQREELSRLGPFEPDNPNTFVSSPLVGETGKNRGLRRLRIACFLHSWVPTRQRRAPVLVQNAGPYLQ